MIEQEYVGIDVSKAYLDVAYGEEGEIWRIRNDQQGIETLVKRLKESNPKLIIIEYTGGLERPALMAMNQVDLSIALVNTRRVREFARAVGLLAKKRID